MWPNYLKNLTSHLNKCITIKSLLTSYTVPGFLQYAHSDCIGIILIKLDFVVNTQTAMISKTHTFSLNECIYVHYVNLARPFVDFKSLESTKASKSF